LFRETFRDRSPQGAGFPKIFGRGRNGHALSGKGATVRRTTPPFRVGIIGCGGISHAHALGFGNLPALFEVRAVCDSNEKAARKLAEPFGEPRICSDWREVIADPEIDAVDILLPHHLHALVGVSALRAGKHVCLEKPLAITLSEGIELVLEAEASNAVFMVAFNERHRWSVRTIKKIVDEGRIGDVYMVRTDHNQNPRFAANAWYRNGQLAGGGALIGSGIHMLDLLQWFCGTATSVFATGVKLPEVLETETAASVIVEFAPRKEGCPDCIGTLDISWAAPNHPWYQFLVVYGTRGTVSTLRGDVVSLRTAGEQEEFHAPEGDTWTDSFREELRHWGECIAQGTRPLTDAREAFRSLEICMAAYRSMDTHTAVRIPLPE